MKQVAVDQLKNEDAFVSSPADAIRSWKWWTKFIPFLVILAVVIWKIDAANHSRRGDFTKFSLAASRLTLKGGNPYDKAQVGRNYKYTPLNAALLAPFTGMNVYAAQGIWTSINVGLLILAIIEHRRFLGRSAIPWWVWLLALACSWRFMWSNIKVGQWNTSVYCLSFIGMSWICRHSVRRGSVLVGLAAVLKYWPASFLVLFAAMRRWKPVGWIIAGCVVWALVVPSLVFGPWRNIELLKNFAGVVPVHYQEIARGKTSYSVSLRSTIYRMLTLSPMELHNRMYYSNITSLSIRKANRISNAVAIAISLLAVLYIWRIARREAADHALANLLIIGLWNCLVLTVSPGVREAHLLTLFTPIYAVAAGVAGGFLNESRSKIVLALVTVGTLATLSAAELTEKLDYHNWLRSHGADTVGTLLIAAAAIISLQTLTTRKQPVEMAMP